MGNDQSCERHNPPRPGEIQSTRSAISRSRSIPNRLVTQDEHRYLPKGLSKPRENIGLSKDSGEKSGLESPQWGVSAREIEMRTLWCKMFVEPFSLTTCLWTYFAPSGIFGRHHPVRKCITAASQLTGSTVLHQTRPHTRRDHVPNPTRFFKAFKQKTTSPWPGQVFHYR